MNTKTKLVNASLALLVLGGAAVSSPARAEGAAKPSPANAAARADIAKAMGFVPQFFLKFPEEALPGVWEEMKTLQLNPSTTLNGRTKELVGLAVASQIPCRYCIVAHTEFAKLNGASETEIGEAVAMAGLTRHWSTFLNGIQTDETKFRAEVAKLVANAKAAAAAKAPAGKPIDVVDGNTALAQAAQMLGFAPEFMQRFPAEARAGAWRQWRDIELSSTTAVSGKNKELMGLAVASQVPCRFCIVVHTEFAKLNGATDAEITEAIAMASLTRDLSTLLNGMQVDESQFRKDVDHIIKNAKEAAKKEHTASR